MRDDATGTTITTRAGRAAAGKLRALDPARRRAISAYVHDHAATLLADRDEHLHGICGPVKVHYAPELDCVLVHRTDGPALVLLAVLVGTEVTDAIKAAAACTPHDRASCVARCLTTRVAELVTGARRPVAALAG